jgi:hypothetical protein
LRRSRRGLAPGGGRHEEDECKQGYTSSFHMIVGS